MEETHKRPSLDFPSFPGNLRRIRKEQGLTFRALSLICEATSANLCRYEQGVHMPRIRALESISRALGVSVAQLLGPFKVKGEVMVKNSTSEPVGYVSGFYGGYCVIQPTDPAVVLPVGMALYRAPTEWVGLTDAELIRQEERQVVLDAIDELRGMELSRNNMFSEGYDYALGHIKELLDAREKKLHLTVYKE